MKFKYIKTDFSQKKKLTRKEDITKELCKGAKYYDLSVIIMHTQPILLCYGQLFKITDI